MIYITCFLYEYLLTWNRQHTNFNVNMSEVKSSETQHDQWFSEWTDCNWFELETIPSMLITKQENKQFQANVSVEICRCKPANVCFCDK